LAPILIRVEGRDVKNSERRPIQVAGQKKKRKVSGQERKGISASCYQTRTGGKKKKNGNGGEYEKSSQRKRIPQKSIKKHDGLSVKASGRRNTKKKKIPSKKSDRFSEDESKKRGNRG